MMNKLYSTFTIAFILFGLSACNRKAPVRDTVWVPIYINKSEAENIAILPPQPVKNAGKIYAYNEYLFQVEDNNGIHVYKLNNNNTPVPQSYIQIFGVKEIAVKNGNLYTNNYEDVIILSLNNQTQISEIARIKNTFKLNSLQVPPEKGYFQCIDTTKGVVIGWEKHHNVEASCIY